MTNGFTVTAGTAALTIVNPNAGQQGQAGDALLASALNAAERAERKEYLAAVAQGYDGQIYFHVRVGTQDRRAVVAMMPTLRQSLREIDPNLPLLQMTPYVDLMEKSPNLWIVKMGAVLFGVFGCIALLLAVVGVYGVKAYAVACRTREIGIRMALGAHRKDVFALIMRQGAMQTALAVTVGILLSLAAGRVLAQILYDVSPSDPFALFASSLMLAVAALLACFLPARRATYVNPITALRTE